MKEILSFLGLANVAYTQMCNLQPTAKFVVGIGLTPDGSFTNDPTQITQWEFASNADGGAVTINTGAMWGDFQAPVYHPGNYWGECSVIPWPISMDITEAASLLAAAGYTQPYNACTLRWPLQAHVIQPFYIFSLQSGEKIAVGVYDKSVSPIY